MKFHVDTVKGLGGFMEIEAQGNEGEERKLKDQCDYYKKELGIKDDDLVNYSYSDLLLDSH